MPRSQGRIYDSVHVFFQYIAESKLRKREASVRSEARVDAQWFGRHLRMLLGKALLQTVKVRLDLEVVTGQGQPTVLRVAPWHSCSADGPAAIRAGFSMCTISTTVTGLVRLLFVRCTCDTGSCLYLYLGVAVAIARTCLVCQSPTPYTIRQDAMSFSTHRS